MWKSLIEWLTTTEPVSRWILIILILGLVLAAAKVLDMVKKHTEKAGEE